MRFNAFIILTILSVILCNAQYSYLKNLEVELWDGICVPTLKCDSEQNKIGMSLGANFRYNFKNKPWDCGIYIQLDQARRITDKKRSNNKTASFGLLGSYNFNNRHSINPFISVGIGAGYNKFSGNEENASDSKWSMAIIPKVGIEFWRFIRLNTYLQLSNKYYNTFGLSLGLTFGRYQ
jgi:hypothetical protein